MAWPFSKQLCPNSEACWSPAMPQIGISPVMTCALPYSSLLPRTAGSMLMGMSRARQMRSSHCSVSMLNSIVREALV